MFGPSLQGSGCSNVDDRPTPKVLKFDEEKLLKKRPYAETGFTSQEEEKGPVEEESKQGMRLMADMIVV